MIEAALAQKTCTPCHGGVPALASDEVRSLLPQAAGWTAMNGDTKIEAAFKFKNFHRTLDFVTKDQGLARERLHHGGEDQRNLCKYGRRRMRSIENGETLRWCYY